MDTDLTFEPRDSGARNGRAGGAILIILGALFLLRQVFGLDLPTVEWPFFILVPGLLCFAGMVAGGPRAGGLAIPGSVLTTLGAIFLCQATFDYFQSWAYVWALLPTAAGVGTLLAGLWSGRPDLARAGRGGARAGLTMFAVATIFFEGIIFRGADLARYVWPLAFIAVGLYLLLGRAGERAGW